MNNKKERRINILYYLYFLNNSDVCVEEEGEKNQLNKIIGVKCVDSDGGWR